MSGRDSLIIPPRVRSMPKVSAPKFVPEYGPLSGIRVLTLGTLIAGPFISTLLSDYGAEVIHIERPKVGDTYRKLGPFIKRGEKELGAGWLNDSRNKLSVTLDIRINRSELAKEILLGLVKQSDILVENLVWLEDRYGITEELLFEVNPSLVIVRVSGYGNAKIGGEKEKSNRAAYDLIGQAYSGWPNIIGFEDGPPTRLALWACDYVTALMGTIGALSAYIKAKATGIGQVVDVAQYEAVARILESYYTAYINAGIVRGREGNKAKSFMPYGIYKAKDGWIAIGAFGPGVYARFIKALSKATGIDPQDYPHDKCGATPDAVASEKGRELDRILSDYIASHTVAEIEDLFNSHSVPCSRIMTPEDAKNDRHWLDRGNFVELIDEFFGEKITYFGIVPKFSKTPGKVWRGSPKLGQDTERVLKELLGYTDDDIKRFKEEGII